VQAWAISARLTAAGLARAAATLNSLEHTMQLHIPTGIITSEITTTGQVGAAVDDPVARSSSDA